MRYILAHSLSLVKHFFQKFFASYSAALSFKLVRSRRGTRLFYHTLSSLSRTFFKFFRGFQPRTTCFQSFFNDFHSLERTCLFYHAALTLSSTFSGPAPSPSSFRSVSFHFSARFCALSRGAQIEYHPSPLLSTPFFTFLLSLLFAVRCCHFCDVIPSFFFLLHTE